VALIGHVAVLSALAYQRTNETILGEPPVAITVDIVSVPAPHAMTVSQESPAADGDSHEPSDAVEWLQPASTEQNELPTQPTGTAATNRAVTLMIAARHSSPKPKVSERPTTSAKRQGAPVVIASAPNPVALSNPGDGLTGGDGANATNSSVPSAWKSRLLSHLDRYKRYPNAARAQRVEGTALLSFEMDRGGRVLTYYLVRSSGWPELDDEVLAMIERASPLPSAPPELNEQIVQLVVPVRFRM
jgi:protein TonB